MYHVLLNPRMENSVHYKQKLETIIKWEPLKSRPVVEEGEGEGPTTTPVIKYKNAQLQRKLYDPKPSL